MESFLNLTTLDTSVDPETAPAILAANTAGVEKNNSANVAMSAGQLEEAIALHRQALALKVRAYSEASVQAGISFNGLGEACLKAGKLQEAEEALLKALKVREETAYGGLGLGPRLDAAATRDELAALSEAQGNFDRARMLRRKGAEKGEMLCGNYQCPVNAMLGLDKLSACASCTSVLYCSKKCQAQDWRSRHKPLCQAHSRASKSSSTTEV
ncbi:hypothetical protein BJ170DRAFT_685725 [Xylariales sp. AK1849]|nr:hypothetical protein BJ170DRAFT_685725 [Xylariales sp. AK1849]